MKALWWPLLALFVLLGFAACESELPNHSPSLQERLQKGIRGEGKLFIPEMEKGASHSSTSTPVPSLANS